jgi:Tfp pilus assembly protein PilF
MLIDRGELEEAARRLADLRKDPRVPPGNAVLLILESNLLKAQKRDAELIAFLQDAGRKTPDNLLAVAELLERHGHAPEAEAAFRAFVAADPKQPERQLSLIAFLTRQNRPADALALCEQAWKTCPAEPASSASTAVLLLCQDHTPEQVHQVETWLEDALKANPDSLVIKRNLASLRNLQNRADQTEAIYRDILARNPEDLEALNNLAFLLAFREGKAAEALQLIDLALQIAGSEPSFLDTRGVIRLHAGQTDQALEDFRSALALEPEIPVLHFHLAQALHKAGQIEEARKALQQAEALGLKSESVDPLERAAHARLRKDLMP